MRTNHSLEIYEDTSLFIANFLKSYVFLSNFNIFVQDQETNEANWIVIL